MAQHALRRDGAAAARSLPALFAAGLGAVCPDALHAVGAGGDPPDRGRLCARPDGEQPVFVAALRPFRLWDQRSGILPGDPPRAGRAGPGAGRALGAGTLFSDVLHVSGGPVPGQLCHAGASVGRRAAAGRAGEQPGREHPELPCGTESAAGVRDRARGGRADVPAPAAGGPMGTGLPCSPRRCASACSTET